MSNSYRIRTEVGVDKSVQVYLDQDFEFLEILSLKLLQSEIYTRPCSDYGVVVGRISVNNGFGVPNAKVSVFIPLSDEDEQNEIISSLYPYKRVGDVNEDGYKYNLLPYKQQHGGHTPTGTFFDRTDILTDSTLIQVFDKYYKYTARTNDSGDFMIFGVPVGTHTIHIDIDVSDIGEFSLFPQDLVRMGRATENQVSGSRFKSSTNLNELPQIISIDRTVEVEPLWGEEDLCNIGITRSDFDLTDGLNFKIEPTAVFMGSLISSNESLAQKRNCKPRLKQGKLCSLVAGPGEILAIRQNVFTDVNGRPGLERFDLDEGGQVIDDNGTWLVEVPMNLDYVVTNEFGEQVISNDPTKGIPTKAKYRFKVKWNQPPTLRDPVKRGYFLVPNIKEYGWTTANDNDPLLSSLTSQQYDEAIKSYAFSLDWNDYGDTGTTVGQEMIQEAISCEDRFYEFTYNKVYTVSQFIDQFRKGIVSNRIIAIKDILEDTCESDNNKFPTNDANYRVDILYLFFYIFIFVMRYVLYLLLIIAHVLAFIAWILGFLLVLIIVPIYVAYILICKFIVFVISLLNGIYLPLGIGSIFNIEDNFSPCPTKEDLQELVYTLTHLYEYFTNLNLPNLTYPDCELCDCKVGEPALEGTPTPPSPINVSTTPSTLAGPASLLSPYPISSNYNTTAISAPGLGGTPNPNIIPQIMTGPSDVRTPRSYTYNQFGSDPITKTIGFTNTLPINERLNLFNVKAKFFNNTPGGGVNQIKATFNVDANIPTVKYHYDNMLVISCSQNTLSNFPTGKLITFQDPKKSKDINLTGLTSLNQYGTPSSTGETTGTVVGTGVNAYTQETITVTCADPVSNVGGSINVNYVITGKTNDSLYHKFPIDIEYFQVITAMTYSTYSSLASNALTNSLYQRVFNTQTPIIFFNRERGCYYGTQGFNQMTTFNQYDQQVLVFLVRGVDPYATRNKNRYDLNKLFGHSNFGDNPSLIFEGMYKPNIPIQPNIKPTEHSLYASDVYSTQTGSYPGNLYFKSFHYKPSVIGDGRFSAFTSTLPNYYSKMSNTNNVATYTFPSGDGLTMNSGSSPINCLIKDFNQLRQISNADTCPQSTFSPDLASCDTIVINGSQFVGARGYLNGEVVDGGAVMAQPYNQYYYSCAFSNINYFNRCCRPSGGYDFPGYYYTGIYSSTYTYNQTVGTDNRQIVMRSERLPTSTTLQGTNPLQSNTSFSLFQVSDDGSFTTNENIQSGGSPNFGGSDADQPDSSQLSTAVFDSFSCPNLIPLKCYETAGTEIAIRPTTDTCYKTDVPEINFLGTTLAKPAKIMDNGCYRVVTSIFFTLFLDFEILTEWVSRIQIMFAACRNVWSHMFTNNWINGTLYAFPINNDRFFTSPSSSNPNQPYSLYCKKTMVLHPTNNYYYRCSPYAQNVQKFIGAPPGETGSGNDRNIMFPTTIMDLGPKNTYIQELVMSDKYDGYVVDKLSPTTFGDVEELLNLFIITRLTGLSFLQNFFGLGGTTVLSYFSRQPLMVDSDYAQAISVNSELGVAPFQAENYPATSLGQDPIYFNDAASDQRIFGVFFSSDTQLRDWITPKRTIIVPNGDPINDCVFNNFGSKSQVVPFYQWGLSPNTSAPNIFGSQNNNWYTGNNVDGGQGFLKYRYQDMDRLLPQSRYFRTNNTNSQSYFPGYIYSVTPSSNPLTNTFDLSPLVTSWSQNAPLTDQFTVGAPFHFYFGLKKGKSSWDRFASKYLDLENIDING
jgi:hypothetical protein